MNADPITTIKEELGVCELLCQLAEESMELGHAALKLRRAIDGKNPTPVSVGEAEDAVLEEVADVSNALIALNYNCSMALLQIQQVMANKQARWVERLEEKKGRGEAHE